MSRRLDIIERKTRGGNAYQYLVKCPIFDEPVNLNTCKKCEHLFIVIDNQVRCRYERNHNNR